MRKDSWIVEPAVLSDEHVVADSLGPVEHAELL